MSKSLLLFLLLTLLSSYNCQEDCNIRRLIYHEFKKGDDGVTSIFGQFYNNTSFGKNDELNWATGPSQCLPLSVRDENGWTKCCYLKIEYEYNDKDYVATGCYPVTTNEINNDEDFDDLEERIEDAVNKQNPKIDADKVHVSCDPNSGSFLKFAMPLVLLLLL